MVWHRLRWAFACVVAALIVGAVAQPAAALTGGDGPIALHATDGIEVAASDGTGLRLILAGASEPSWSPTGNRISYLGADNQIWIARADGSHAHVLSLPSEAGAVRWPQWSPDGRLTYNHGTNTILVDADGSHRRVLPSSFWTSWTPDGRLVLLRGDYSGRVPWHLSIGRGDGTAFQTVSPSDPNPGGVLPDTDPWQFSALGLVAYHEWTADIADQTVAYGALSGRTISFLARLRSMARRQRRPFAERHSFRDHARKLARGLGHRSGYSRSDRRRCRVSVPGL